MVRLSDLRYTHSGEKRQINMHLGFEKHTKTHNIDLKIASFMFFPSHLLEIPWPMGGSVLG